MKVVINPKMFSKNSVPLALEIEHSTELAMYVQRNGDWIVYTHNGQKFELNMKEVHAKN